MAGKTKGACDGRHMHDSSGVRNPVVGPPGFTAAADALKSNAPVGERVPSPQLIGPIPGASSGARSDR